VATVVATGLLPALSHACSVCWGADDALAHGLNVSILFLMSMPFLIVGSIVGVLLVARRQHKDRRRSIFGSLIPMQKERVK
jgi:hypothetical protein